MCTSQLLDYCSTSEKVSMYPAMVYRDDWKDFAKSSNTLFVPVSIQCFIDLSYFVALVYYFIYIEFYF